MLLKFRFSNFRSFRTEQELSLIASKLPRSGDGLFSSPGLKEQVLPIAAIYGANASGKTAVIRAIGFMVDAVKWSQTHWLPDAPVPVDPFVAGASRVPSEFAADFLLSGIRYQYGFTANPEAILHEWLYVYPKGKRRIWFERIAGDPISFGAKMPGENRTIEGLVRKNSLFLSAAAQNNHEVLSPVYRWFSQSISHGTGDKAHHVVNTAQLCQDETDRAVLTRLLAYADLGISELRLEDIPWGLNTGELLAAWPGAMAVPDKRALRVVQLLHRIGGQSVPLEARQESNGTLTYLSLLGPIVSALKTGAVLCIDELDKSLHPLIAVQVIRLFNSRPTNSQNAQLIFNTHDTNLLSSGDLRRDQIWFTEKDAEGSSHLYPLTDFKPRRQENLENGYLQGRYGAIPFIHPDFLAGSAGGNGEKS
jgi:hypothetical protein